MEAARQSDLAPLPPAPTDPRRPVVHALTGIRFFAAMMVLLFHFGAGFAARVHAPRPIVTLLENGYVGVSLFFMLSGFIITYTYDGRLRTRADHGDFFVARFSRIYPVYLLALVLALPFAWTALTPGRAVAVLAMVQSWTFPASSFGYSWEMQAWTLSVELFFYLCAPLLLAALRRAPARALACGALAMALLMPILWVPMIHPGALAPAVPALAYVPIPAVRLIEFVYGMLLCKLLLGWRERWRGLAAAPLVIANLAAIAAILMVTKAGAAMGVAMALAGVLLLQLATGETIVSRFLSQRWMLLLGASSYALYLIQSPVREWLRLLAGPTLSQALNPFVAVALSVLIFRLWEEPARKWLRRRLSTPRHAAAPDRPLLPAAGEQPGQ